MASGDPRVDRVVLWTRLSGVTGTAAVDWKVATDPDLTSVVSSGRADATAAADHTVTVDADGLNPASTYWYGFEEPGGARSPTGRTRTAPAGSVDRLRLGVACCAHWATGYFGAYGHLAERDVDVVLHLGDYIYEADGKKQRGVRRHDPPGRMTTLGEYRARYSQYRTDPELQKLHLRHPIVAVWDDHELAGNAWYGGAARHFPATDGAWETRRQAAVRAYREWMPVRFPDPDDRLRLWRTLGFGDLLDVVMLDTRLAGRDRPAAGRRPVLGLQRRSRSLLGDAQRRWLGQEFARPAAAWRIVTSQVVMAPVHMVAVPPRRARLGRLLGAVDGGVIVNPGQWDGYPEERDGFLALAATRRGDVVVMSGDLHSSWASELRRGATGEPVAVEFAAPAVSAPSFARALAPKFPGGRRMLERLIRAANPHVRYVDTRGHGYVVLDVTPERVAAEWWHVDTLRRRGGGERLAATWTVERGDPRLLPG